MNDPGKIIFIHIPKTGGRSVLKALGKTFSTAHLTLAELCAKDQSVMSSDAFRFTVVRNPWERTLSWWMFFNPMCAPFNQKTFPEWLEAKRKGFFVRDAACVRKLPMCQMSYCRRPDGTIGIDHFLRYESLAAGFASLAPRLGVDPVLPTLGMEDKKKRIANTPEELRSQMTAFVDDYRNAYSSQEMIDSVAQMDSETIERFGYTF